MLVYRITKSKRATDISGTRASLFPGRWNKRGTAVLYTGSSREIALLEIMVHLPPMIIPNLDILTIEIPDDSISELSESDLPSGWHQFPAPSILSEIGQRWVDGSETLALKVPSSIIHSAKIVVLNCQHKSYTDVSIVDQRKFCFDSRLRK